MAEYAGSFSPETVARIHALVRAEPSISRRALSRRVCEWLDWRSPSGRLREMSCRKSLCALERQGVLDLPKAKRGFAFERPRSTPPPVETARFQGSLKALGAVEVRMVTSRYCKDSQAWRGLMERYHYLGAGGACGAQVRYVVHSRRWGYLGALAFSSGTWALAARDAYIGWSEEARRAHLGQVVCNTRFLIAPGVKAPNLASHVLGRVLKRLPEDWEQRYGVRPVLVETFVDPRRFAGTCYRAANFVEVGQTAGRRDGCPKTLFLRPLSPQWRQTLCAEPLQRLGTRPRPVAPSNWAEEEFGRVRLHDPRLKKRLYTIAQDFFRHPQSNIPEACGSKARTMGAYRFFQNKKVTMDVLLTAHTEATVERMRKHRVVLAPQDTTTLNYTHPMTEGLGPTGTKEDTSVGLLLHDTLAFSEDGVPLGVLDAQCWARDPEDRGRKVRRQKLPIEQKESMKWLRSFRKVAQVQQLCPAATVVSIGDSEADIYDLFEEALRDPAGPKLLVRMRPGTKRKTHGTLLWDFMAQQETAGSVALHIPHSGSRKARDTLIHVRHAAVELQPPKRCATAQPIRAWAVHAREDTDAAAAAGADTKPIEWMLVTTAPVTTLEDARQRMDWYAKRWGIEVYHRTLKSGCKIKSRQLESAEGLQACLGVDMVVAWRVFHLAMLGRDTPDLPCTAFFTDTEWKALWCYTYEDPNPPPRLPTMGEAMRMVARMGGYLDRKNDGPPGAQTIWRGLQKLSPAARVYAIMAAQLPTQNTRSP